MKRILYMITLAAVAAACTVDNLEPERISGIEGDLLGYEHDGKVTYGFNPVFSGTGSTGTTTKAMVEGADIKNLYVAVFDGSGYKLSEYIKAEPVTTGSNLENGTPYQYTIELKVTEKKRVLHFIANAPEDLRFGSENEVIGELFTSLSGDDTQSGGFQNAYWQRIELENGVVARPREGDENYSGKLAGYNSVINALNGVTLIRNYSKVSVDVAPACYNFVLSGFWFVNYPDRGTVAPYNRKTKTFVTDYKTYTSVEALEDTDGADYQGFMLQATEFLTPSYFDDSNMYAVSSGSASGFVYEREKALISPMYIIIKGDFYPDATALSPLAGTHTTGYYKVAMQDNDGEFYAMLRNFNYLVRISSVAAAGKTSAEQALASTPSGDISVNVDYKDIPSISDGSARMTVNQTTLMIIGQNGQPASAEILYKYEPDIVNHPGEGLGNEWVAEEPSTPITDRPYVTITLGEAGSTGEVIADMQVSDNVGDGFGHIAITTTNVSNLPKQQTVTITGKRYDNGVLKTITRAVNLVLRESLEMALSVEPNTDTDPSSTDYNNGFIETGTGKGAVLNIAIEDNLPSSMFPLVFKIEPTNKTVTPDNAHSSEQDLPVRYGTDAAGYPTYWFEKSLTYAEYTAATARDGIKTFPVWFQTILASSATTFKVSQDMFEPEEASLKNFTPSTFSSAAFSASSHKVGTQETFSFHIDGTLPAEIIIKMKGVEPVKATAPATTGYAGSGFNSMTWQKTSDGYWYYTIVPNSADVSLNVVPYASGQASVEVSAYLYNSVSAAASVAGGSNEIITGSDFITPYGQKVYGNNLVPRQKAMITVYLSGIQSSDTVTIDGMYTTKVDNAGTWKVYTANNAYTATTDGYDVNGYYDELIVRVGDIPIGTIKVPICGIRTGTALSSASQAKYDQTNGTGWYVITNDSFSGYHLYYDGSNIKGRQTSTNPYDYYSLFGFETANSGSTKVAVPSANTDSMYQVNEYNDVLNTTSSGTNYSFNGHQFSYSGYYTYYWRESSNTGVVSGNRRNNDYRTFNVYPATLNIPTE